jgi:hypothetical protein
MKRIAIFILLTLAGSDMFGQKMDNKNTTLIWDTSLSMKDRDLNKDFSVLEKVFSRVPDQEVQLILFNISTEEKTYHIKDGNWQVLLP